MNLRQFFTRHSWWGKVIGAFLGYLIAGPAGALFGILIGNFFDRGLALHFSRPYWHYYAEKRKEAQAVFFEAIFSIMGYIAKLDGRVSQQEIFSALSVMKEMKLTKQQQREAKNFFNQGKSNSFEINAILNKLAAASEGNLDLLRLFIEAQYRMAKVDGITQRKQATLDHILQSLGFAPLHRQYHFYEDFVHEAYKRQRQYGSQSSNWRSEPKQNNVNTLTQAFMILGVSPEASKQEIKKAYRKLISKNHPDRLIAQGLSEEDIKKATDKTQKIRKAYEHICLSKGW